MAFPSSVTVEIEFTAGVWTDVTAYFDSDSTGSTRFGRTSPFGATSPGTLTVTLSNQDGRFTPGRQVLADGVTANPYYPNVLPRKRIRVAYVVGGTPYYRFTGYVKGWPPTLVGAAFPRVTITATSRDDRLSRVTLRSAVVEEYASDAARLYWPLTDAAEADAAAEISGGGVPLTMVEGSTDPVVFGGKGLSGNGTAVTFAPPNATDGGMLVNTALGSSAPNANSFSLELWINPGKSLPVWAGASGHMNIAGFSSVESPFVDGQFFIDQATGKPGGGQNTGTAALGPASVVDGGWHQLVFTNDGVTGKFYVDGALAGSTSATSATATPLRALYLGDWTYVAPGAESRYQGRIAHVALYSGVLSAAAVARHWTGGRSGYGETVDTRIGRLLGYGGLTSASWTLDASTVALSGYDQTGKDVVTACQDAATSEGGGAAFYVGTDGKAQFRNRSFRKPGSPAFTVDAAADLDGSVFQPAFDDTLIVNQVQGTRATGSGAATTQTVNDAASQSAYEVTSSSFTSYAKTDADVLYNAQDQLARQRNPAYQIPQVAVDLGTAMTAGLYAAVAGVAVGSRIRLSNLPAGAAPTTQCDLYVEGWGDTFSTTGYAVTFDTSPADTPPWFLWEDATYGRWQCDGQTLNAAITNSATTVVVATAAGKPTFSTSAGAYPLTIQVGAEQITLNSAPGGSASPQTFTGVTRGVNGTTAAAQAISAAVDLAPASTWTL